MDSGAFQAREESVSATAHSCAGYDTIVMEMRGLQEAVVVPCETFSDMRRPSMNMVFSSEFFRTFFKLTPVREELT